MLLLGFARAATGSPPPGVLGDHAITTRGACCNPSRGDKGVLAPARAPSQSASYTARWSGTTTACWRRGHPQTQVRAGQVICIALCDVFHRRDKGAGSTHKSAIALLRFKNDRRGLPTDRCRGCGWHVGCRDGCGCGRCRGCRRRGCGLSVRCCTCTVGGVVRGGVVRGRVAFKRSRAATKSRDLGRSVGVGVGSLRHSPRTTVDVQSKYFWHRVGSTALSLRNAATGSATRKREATRRWEDECTEGIEDGQPQRYRRASEGSRKEGRNEEREGERQEKRKKGREAPTTCLRRSASRAAS